MNAELYHENKRLKSAMKNLEIGNSAKDAEIERLTKLVKETYDELLRKGYGLYIGSGEGNKWWELFCKQNSITQE